jgi:uncharacterized RDD family membrane protein YckC
MESTGSPGSTPPEEGLAPQAPPSPSAGGATPPASASTTPGWVSTITSSATLAGPAGLVYADVPSRIFAYIIDVIIMAVGFGILYGIFLALFIGSALGGLGFMAFVWFVVMLVIYAAGSAIYFIYTWTRLRGSPGQRMLGMETLNAADGAALTQPQAIRRWLFLFGPFVLGQVASLMLGGIGTLFGLALFAYAIYLLYTTGNSPLRQGFHDVQASTVVVKVTR